ncbi:MAG: hypothetical protein OEW75_18600 [Cyclobacteriaceae bacterium]|nr:hypothetical protein [Cyclobacteriaceae bacterium]
MKVINLFLITYLSFISLNSFSQKNFLEGYYVNNEGDTIRGLIDYRNWKETPQFFTFKKSINSEREKIDLSGAIMFSVSEENYILAQVDVMVSNRDRDYSQEAMPIIIREEVFIQLLISGEKNLYYYGDHFGRKNFYFFDDGIYKLFIYKKYISRESTGTFSRENKKFIGQLNNYLGDCQAIPSITKDLNYNKLSLKNAFKKYYSCISTEPEYFKKGDEEKYNLGIFGGYSRAQYNNSLNYLNTKYSPSNSITFGVNVERVWKRKNEKWSGINSIYYTSFSTDWKRFYYTDINNSTMYYYQKKFGYVKTNHMIRYKIPIGKTQFFINEGINTGLTIKRKYTYEETRVVDSTISITNGIYKGDSNYPSYNIGFVGGAGIKAKNISSEIRYEITRESAKYHGSIGVIQRWEVLFAYWF